LQGRFVAIARSSFLPRTPVAKPIGPLATPENIIELARRGGAEMKLEDVQAIEYAIQMGRGNLWLNLTEDQYRKLKKIR